MKFVLKDSITVYISTVIIQLWNNEQEGEWPFHLLSYKMSKVKYYVCEIKKSIWLRCRVLCKILYWKHRNLEYSVVICFFFLSRFSSHTLTIHRTAGGGRGPSFVPLYLFHPLMNNETFICNFACEMTITHFYSQHLCLPDYCYSIRFTTISNYHMIDWLMQCLFTW